MELGRYQTTVFGRAGRTPGAHGYVAYFPKPIPRSLDLSPATVVLLSEAEAALGRLAGIGQLLRNPYLLIRPYLRREALASSRIEGTQASFADLFEFDGQGGVDNADVEEVLNYVAALELAVERLESIPISMRLLREIHGQLLAGVRGRDRRPGELRTSQNWIRGRGFGHRDGGICPATSWRTCWSAD